MADDRKIRLVIKDHYCDRVGEVAAFESFVGVSRVNDVGEATLVAGYGASDDNDDVLDSLDTADMILEAYIKPPGATEFLDDPAWAGFLRDARIRQDGPSRVGTYIFKDYNHLLTRRVVIPPEGGSHDEHYGTTANIMRDLVREHAAENADVERQIPGLSVEANDDVETPGLYSDTTAMVFGTGLPEYVRVNDLFEWNGWLYLGTETEPDSGNYAAIYRSADGTTWTKVMDGASPVEGLYGYPITAIHCFAQFGSWLYAGCSQDWGDGSALIMRTFNGDDWSLAATLPNEEGVWALAEFDGMLYAGTTGDQYRGSRTYLWRSADGMAWTACANADVSIDNCPCGYVDCSGQRERRKCEALYEWGDHLYLGVMYKRAICYGLYLWGPGYVWHRARIYRTDDGTTIDQVFDTNSAHGFLSFMEFGDYLYAGSGRTRWDSFFYYSNIDYASGGRIYRTSTGAAWTQVFGGNLDNTHYSSAISDMMVSTDVEGVSALWAASGWRKGGSAFIYYSLDGETWTKGATIAMLPYAFTLALALFSGDAQNYAGMGCYAHSITNPGLGDYWTADHGDVWRVVLSAGDLAESGAIGRWGTLLDKLREIAEQSGNHDFRVVGLNSLLYCDVYQTFQFQVRYPQWGTDNRWDEDELEGISFSVQRGNMDQPEYAVIRGGRPNYLYLLGPSAGEERTVDEYPDAVSMGESPWNRVEGTVNAQGVDTASARNSMGWSELELQGPYREFSFQSLETEYSYYPDTWTLGDLVTASFAGVLAQCKITEVALIAMEGAASYIAQPTFKVLEVEPEGVATYIMLAVGAYDPLAVTSISIYRATTSDDWALQTTFTDLWSGAQAMIQTEEGTVVLGTVSAQGWIYRSEDYGINWQKVQRLGTETEVMSLVETDDGTLLAGTYPNGRIYRSTDDGETWVLAQTLDSSDTWNYIDSMVVAANGDIIAAWAGQNFGGYDHQEMWRSQDDGLTWTQVDTLTNVDRAYCMIRAANNDLIAGTFNVGDAGEFWRSQNNGATWAQVATCTGNNAPMRMVVLSDDTILAGTWNAAQAECWRSLDNGATWAKLSDMSPAGSDTCWSLSLGIDGEAVVAGMEETAAIGDATIYESTDGGATWEEKFDMDPDQYSTVDALLRVEVPAST